MASWKMIWFYVIFMLTASSCQVLKTVSENQGLCKSVDQQGFFGPIARSLAHLHKKLKDCVVIVGSLKISLYENSTVHSFRNISFPNLREVTEFLVVYRLHGVESLGQLFPNLVRIRGQQLLSNYALIVHDMPSLTEVGLYSLMKIDRGGVIVWAVPQACFVDTVDWKSIAPRSRHVISHPAVHCNAHCTCSTNSLVNRCWNNRKCQRFLAGPEVEKCHDQCLGCRKTNMNECSICRHYTFKGSCISKCPTNTIILPDCQYCITLDECHHLKGWRWNNNCIFKCPLDYTVVHVNGVTDCEPCPNCRMTCHDQVIQSTHGIQDAQGCVFINGSLVIHIRAIPEAMEEMRTYLSTIEEVSDYVVIYGSISITSLDFLSSLRRIKGQKLKNGKFSLLIYDMTSLQTLFTPNVTKNLKIDRGTFSMTNNPMLCTSQIEKIKDLFPEQPSELDLPPGSNGYSGGCEEVAVNFQIRVLSETSAVIMFPVIADPDAHYSVLYVLLPPGIHSTVVPETCSESEWYAVSAPTQFGHQFGYVELVSLHPASTYAVCIEIYDPIHRRLARSTIANFTTPVGKPEPPFFVELVAINSEAVVLRWVDHKVYLPYISHYELDVSLIEIYPKDLTAINHCSYIEDFVEIDYTRHAIVRRPPSEYASACESMCGILSSATVGALVEEHFDVCSSIRCDGEESAVPGNSTIGNHVRTMVLTINGPKNKFQIGKLAPFRDYRFRLRSCTRERCSRSARGVVRTLRLFNADIPTIVDVNATKTGHITVKWTPAYVTNGPILAYFVEVLPKIKQSSVAHLLPQSWCVFANETGTTVKSEIASKYLVRVCARSLASSSACSGWSEAFQPRDVKPTWWWTGVIFGIMLYIASCVAGYLWKFSRASNDLVPLVSAASSLRNESEPPSKMFSDFVPFYSVPLRDTSLD